MALLLCTQCSEDGDQNRREEFMEYDPALYALIAEFLPDEPQFVDCYSDE